MDSTESVDHTDQRLGMNGILAQPPAAYHLVMAAYDYRCRVCDTVFETRRAITEQATDVQCPEGHTDVARIWSAVAITGSARSTAAPAPAPAMAGGGGCCGGGCCG